MTELSPDALEAIEQLRLLPGNWRIMDFGGQFRVTRLNGDSYHVGVITDDHWTGLSRAAIKGLAFVKSMLADEAARQALPRYTFGKAVFGSSAK